ncbi:MAG: glycosyltransferase [Clostridia bacterium]|nr:glycosyltransferase [Clostridia bacterium]
MSKKVLFVINTLGRAGAETAMLELLRRMNSDEYQISLYVLMNQGELVHDIPNHVTLLNSNFNDRPVLTSQGRKELLRFSLSRSLKHHSLIKNTGYILINLFRMIQQGQIHKDKLIWKIISDGSDYFSEEFDIAIAYLEGGATYYVANHVKAKTKIAFVHVDYHLAGYDRFLDQNCYREIDHIFTVSDEVKSSFLNVYPECENRLSVFHNLLNKDRILDKSLQNEGFSDDYSGFRILTVGRLTIQKAFDVSIHAMKLLKEHGANVRWYVLGEGDQREFLEKLISELKLEKDFLLLGNQPNPYPYYKQTDLYVHASRFEGKSIAIQEAQILGCPILVSDCNGNREQVIDGVDGAVCELNAQSICKHILELINSPDLRTKYGNAASNKLQQNEAELEHFLNVIESSDNTVS